MKGISTFLATILLIAFTLTVAVIIGSWLTSMSSQQSSIVGVSVNQTVTCSKGVLSIVTIPSNTTVIIQNQGQIDLSGTFTLTCGTNITATSSVGLPKGTMVTLTSSGCKDSGNKIRVSSQICPSVYVECTYGTNCPS
jgi:FlaG/FlaF family flagellin (archaellin)